MKSLKIKELMYKRYVLYSQIRKINEQLEQYTYDCPTMQVGDLYYDNNYFYLVLEKMPSKATVLCYSKYDALEIRTATMYYADLLYFTKVEADNNALENLINRILSIKNGKKL